MFQSQVRHMPGVLPKEGLFPGIQYRVPGHGVADIIDMTGKGVMEWKDFDEWRSLF